MSEKRDPTGRAEREAEAEQLEAELAERRDAAMAEVRKFGDPVLKSPASEITDFGEGLGGEGERMIALMRDALGIGLAATQVGVMRRLLVFRAGPDAAPRAIVNPRVEWTSDDLVTAEEGCLSLPGVVVDVERPLFARISARDTDGNPLSLEASGLEARVLQHEIDHLDGVLIVDRTVREQRRGALRAMRAGESFSPDMLLEAAEGEPGTPAGVPEAESAESEPDAGAEESELGSERARS
jgi:peptide deformylase